MTQRPTITASRRFLFCELIFKSITRLKNSNNHPTINERRDREGRNAASLRYQLSTMRLSQNLESPHNRVIPAGSPYVAGDNGDETRRKLGDSQIPGALGQSTSRARRLTDYQHSRSSYPLAPTLFDIGSHSTFTATIKLSRISKPQPNALVPNAKPMCTRHLLTVPVDARWPVPSTSSVMISITGKTTSLIRSGIAPISTSLTRV